MPFINVKVAGPALDKTQVETIQKGITALMADVLDKVADLAAVLVEQVPIGGWTIGAKPVERAAHVDATVSQGTNSPEQKARFIARTDELLRRAIGPELPLVTYIVVHDAPKDSWGYGGLTQAHRAEAKASK